MSERLPYLSSILWCLAGGIAGAGVGLMLAPQSGKATRQMMARGLSESADSVRQLKDRVVVRGKEIRDETARRMGEAVSVLSGERKVGNGSDSPSAT
jgi:gas vesicle protein